MIVELLLATIIVLLIITIYMIISMFKFVRLYYQNDVLEKQITMRAARYVIEAQEGESLTMIRDKLAQSLDSKSEDKHSTPMISISSWATLEAWSKYH